MSWLYIKVDTNNVGLPKPWNTSTNDDWKIYPDTDSYAYPYSDYGGDKASVDKDFRPGKSLISNIDGFELFSIVSNNKRYTYSTDNDHFDDKRYDGYTNKDYSDPLVHPDDENKSMIEYFFPKQTPNVANISMLKPNTEYTLIYKARFRNEGEGGMLVICMSENRDEDIYVTYHITTTYQQFALKFTTLSSVNYFTLRANSSYFYIKD